MLQRNNNLSLETFLIALHTVFLLTAAEEVVFKTNHIVAVWVARTGFRLNKAALDGSMLNRGNGMDAGHNSSALRVPTLIFSDLAQSAVSR